MIFTEAGFKGDETFMSVVKRLLGMVDVYDLDGSSSSRTAMTYRSSYGPMGVVL